MSLLNTEKFSAVVKLNQRIIPWLIGLFLISGILTSIWMMTLAPFIIGVTLALALIGALPQREDHLNHRLQRQPDLDTLSRLSAEDDLQRSVFDVTSELVSCVNIRQCSEQFSRALCRYWRHQGCSCWLWDKGTWTMLPLDEANAAMVQQQNMLPPTIRAPVTLPKERDPRLVIDLSPAVSGQAVLILHQASAQPTISDQPQHVIASLAEVLRAQLALALRRATLHNDLSKLARKDPLTEVDRRWYGEERLRELLRNNDAIVAMLDIDHFKQINDRYGHVIGDQVLKRVGTTLRKHLRPSDIVFRYGGEEFVVAIKGNDLDQGTRTIQRLMDEISSDTKSMPTATLSGGAIQAKATDEIKDVIQHADSACYKAKKTGRNQLIT